MRAIIKAVLLAGAAHIAWAVPASADREPTAQERTQIEQTLRSQGYSSWEGIEYDDDMWEVDDAQHTDGRKYDLKVDPKSYQIIKRDG